MLLPTVLAAPVKPWMGELTGELAGETLWTSLAHS